MAHLNFEFRFEGAGVPRRNDDGGPFRLLVIGDFSGRASRRLCETLAGRKPLALDIDTLDAAMARIAPSIGWGGDGPTQLPMHFQPRALDDFHPDALFACLPLFKALRETRAQLADPLQFAAAAAALRQAAAAPPEGSPAPAAEADAATLERLLGKAPVAAVAAAPAAEDALQALIGRIVAPHIVPASDPMQAQYLASLDASLGDAMRALLHAPAFQALEALWRGVAWLISRLELDENLRLFILDASKDELAADLAAAGSELDRAGLHRLLLPEDAPWSLMLGAFECDAGEDDVGLLAALSAMAAQAGAPMLAGAAPGALGCAAFHSTPDPRDWTALTPVAQARWRALRTSSGARWLGLVAPRLLLRLPYGAKSDPVESFAFEEFAGRRQHANYLWGCGAFACAELLGRAFSENGWDMAPSDLLDIEDLPAHSYLEDGESCLQPCAEVALSERGSTALFDAGVIALSASRHRNAVRVQRIHSLALPAQALAGPWQTI